MPVAAKRYYTVAQLSEHLAETPEGYLVCLGVPIARAGTLLYQPHETPDITPGTGPTAITRTVDDIHDPDTIASFEGKPVTLLHSQWVTPANWADVTVGVTQNVRPGEGAQADMLIGDLLITDFDGIDAVRSKNLREVSCAYEADFEEIEPGVGRQRNIRGNHVALVETGRCGPDCAIFDHDTQAQEKPMTLKDRFLARWRTAADATKADDVAKAFDEATAEEIAVKATTDVAVPVADADPPPAAAAEPAADPIAAKLDAVLAALTKLIEMASADKSTEAAEPVADAGLCKDADTIARAEILAPGIAKTTDVKGKALAACYATEDGKKIIEPLLSGKALDAADPDVLFVAASELVKALRREQLAAATRPITDAKTKDEGPMTADRLAQKHAEFRARSRVAA